MIGRGYLFALGPEELNLALSHAHRRELQMLVDRFAPTGQVAELDKAWLAIDRCLALGFPEGPITRAVLGRAVVADRAGILATLVPPEEVPVVARELERVGEETFREGFEACAGPDPDGESEELDVLYAWGWFQRLRALYRRAAGEGRAVLFTAELWPGAAREAAAAPGP